MRSHLKSICQILEHFQKEQAEVCRQWRAMAACGYQTESDLPLRSRISRTMPKRGKCIKWCRHRDRNPRNETLSLESNFTDFDYSEIQQWSSTCQIQHEFHSILSACTRAYQVTKWENVSERTEECLILLDLEISDCATERHHEPTPGCRYRWQPIEVAVRCEQAAYFLFQIGPWIEFLIFIYGMNPIRKSYHNICWKF